MRPTRFEIMVLLVVCCLGAYIYLPLRAARIDEARATHCLNNLRDIGSALGAYLTESDRRWPYVGKLTSSEWPTVVTILEGHVAPDDERYVCPSDERTLPGDDARISEFGASTTWHATEGLSYEWVWPLAYGGYPVGEENLSKASGEGKGRADQDLMSDFEAFHFWGLNTLFADLAARPPRDAARMK